VLKFFEVVMIERRQRRNLQDEGSKKKRKTNDRRLKGRWIRGKDR
jgi:hypothetical protein